MEITIDNTDLDCFRVEGEMGPIHVRGGEMITINIDGVQHRLSVAGFVDFVVAVNKED